MFISGSKDVNINATQNQRSLFSSWLRNVLSCIFSNKFCTTTKYKRNFYVIIIAQNVDIKQSNQLKTKILRK